MQANAKVNMMSLGAVVTRHCHCGAGKIVHRGLPCPTPPSADVQELVYDEPYRTLAYYHKNPLKRLVYRLTGKALA
jgi:hypothetical protein